jgi:hypothetical protein
MKHAVLTSTLTEGPPNSKQNAIFAPAATLPQLASDSPGQI